MVDILLLQEGCGCNKPCVTEIILQEVIGTNPQVASLKASWLQGGIAADG